MGKEENQNGYMIPGEEGFGQVQIADEVVAIIAGLAATEMCIRDRSLALEIRFWCTRPI